jgi:hypothetical protein
MKRVGNIAIWLAAGLLLSAGARADNPYTPVVERNIFGLKPAVDEAPPGDPPPKITLNGIMSISGHFKALYKVAGTSKPGQSDQSYILSEGQRQDDIEVTHIDDKASLVTFNNHGVVQEIPLANAPAATGSAPGQGSPGSFRANFSRAMGGRSGGENAAGNSFGRGGGGRQNRGAVNNANQNQNPPTMGGDPNVLPIPTRGGTSGQIAPSQTPNKMPMEEQMVMIAAMHLKAQQEGDPIAPIYPPTPIDADAGIGGNPSPP